MLKSQIIPIPIFPFGMINAFLIRGTKGAVLIDTGLPETEKTVGKVLKQNGLTFEDIKLIIITHAHIDHAGNTQTIRKLAKNPPVIGHTADLKYFLGEEAMKFCSTGMFGRLFKKTGLIQRSYPKFTPEITLDGNDEFDLTPYGISGKVLHTPGHTPGSISVELNNDQVIVGDMLSSGILLGGIIRKNRAKRPPFEENPNLVAQELKQLIKRGATTFHMGHGGPLNVKEVLRHADYLESL